MQYNSSFFSMRYTTHERLGEIVHRFPLFSTVFYCSTMIYTCLLMFCRSISLKHTSSVTLKGVDLYRFTPPDTMLQSGNGNPDNQCFCRGTCLKDGALDISVCRGGSWFYYIQWHGDVYGCNIEVVRGMDLFSDRKSPLMF